LLDTASWYSHLLVMAGDDAKKNNDFLGASGGGRRWRQL
jgi:hypothetical protein